MNLTPMVMLYRNLATDMPEISEDGLAHTIKMRGDTKWSDGKPVKASDFVFAWQ